MQEQWANACMHAFIHYAHVYPAGTLPEAWYSSLPPRLRVLDLSDNQIKGRLSTAALPDTLEQFRLSKNAFSGPIPEEWQLPPLLQLLVSEEALRAVCLAYAVHIADIY